MDEALRMGEVGGLERGLALGLSLGGSARMHHTRSEQAQAGVLMRVVVPGKKRLGPSACVDQAAEEGRKRWMIFECLELGLRIGIVVGDMRPRWLSRSLDKWRGS